MSDLEPSASPGGNEYFDRAALKLFGAPQCWSFISPFQPLAEHTAAGKSGRGKFKQWMGKHRHAHPFYEALLAVSGAAWYGVNGKIFRCRPGTMALIAPNQPHPNRYLPDDDRLLHIWVSFITPEQAFLQFVMVRRGRVKRVHGERSLINTGGLGRLLQCLPDLAKGGSPTAPLQVKLLLTAFFAELIHLIIESGHQPAGVIDREALVRKKIAMICEHIRRTGGAQATLADLALLTGYTPGHFARKFKQFTGQTVHQHIDACRLERAKAMLARHLPLKKMAAELGFADKTTLSRWLNKYRRAVNL